MQATPLGSCRVKLDRAREHVAALASAEHDYFGANGGERPFAIDPHFDPATNLYSFVGRVIQAPPLRIGAVLGDIVHNLRSALDHLVWQLVWARSGDPELLGRPYPDFPVCLDAATWPKVAGGRLCGVSHAAAERIREAQPFVTNAAAPERTPLSRLDALWNRDKHRLVTTTAAAIGAIHDGLAFVRTPVSPQDVQLIPVRDVATIHEAESFWGVPLDGHPIVQARITPSGPGPLIELRGKSVAGLALEDNSPLNHTVAAMAETVEDVVTAFEKHWGTMAS
jgi:hypothetical protein